ncbi:indolepyruvate ferredoxin oxidoreductase subunit alpha [Limisalsivibrio acetivorans]|uniref:indolepyruvate ferredoxin oxidoreductase subunit alpha n=1 Tax=Limisalsivibrio acetivorans TaxID=1304888 RepID=UPI0003B34313|nr:indolepyruvate ferredoxin oxidoreductase subunit alpha [Limisalsivibrio acetivorans]
MKEVLSGNEAIARGAYEAGVMVVSSYPGTPSTEITQHVAEYEQIYSEWSTNEKVSLEVAIGSSLAGKRAMTCMKHVGLNVAADPLMTVSYTGVNAGLVIVVADDPNMFSSQNEQDSRHYARFAKIPMLEPADSQEAKDFIARGLELSEKFSTPVLVRSCTRLSHSKSVVQIKPRHTPPIFEPENDIKKWVMVPANARQRHKFVEKRLEKIARCADEGKVCMNPVEMNSEEIGIVCAGVTYQYVKEALPEASVLKLEMVWPLPMEKIKRFAEKVDKLYVVEELDPFLETELKAAGVEVQPLERDICGELSTDRVKELFGTESPEPAFDPGVLPARPPNMCPGCSHRGVFYAISKLKLFAAGDIGCYTLGLLPPLNAINSTVCMGASIPMAHGMDRATEGELAKKSVAVIGDSTFFHTGLPGLLNSVYNSGCSTVVILDNRITGMTGHQQNPGSGCNIKGEPAPQVNFPALLKAMGVNNIRTVDPFNVEDCLDALKEETAKDEVSVILTNRPCIFADRSVMKPPFYVDEDNCCGCTACTRLGCPAILWKKDEKKAFIDETLCTGCELCSNVCRFDAIHQRES